MIIRIAVLLSVLLPVPLVAQSPAPAPPTVPAPEDDLVPVAIETSLGRIVIALDRGRAPVTTANFLRYVDSGRFDGETFYRAMRMSDGGLIQGGVRDGAKQLAPIAIETTATTGLGNKAGAIVMANAGGMTTRSDFFILTTDVASFDATATSPGFAPFGRVVEGMDVVKAIFASPRSPTKGEGVMKGQMLDPVVKIVKAARVK